MCERISRPIEGESRNAKKNMKKNVPIKKQPVAAKRQAPGIQRRINGGWLKPQTVQSLKSKVQSQEERRPAAVERLASLLSVWLALALLASGCAGPRPLKGGKAITTHKPAGVIEQTLVQSENPSQASKQTQESVKVRTYTVPAGSRMEQSQPPAAAPAQLSTINSHPINLQPSTISSQPINLPPSTLNLQPSTAFVLSAPMPVVEREETRAGTELGAAQKDTARELGAKLASLKGIVWVGVGLFVFGLASLVYPPLKVIIGSVTTSAALLLGGPGPHGPPQPDRRQRAADPGRCRFSSRWLVPSSSPRPIAQIG